MQREKQRVKGRQIERSGVANLQSEAANLTCVQVLFLGEERKLGRETMTWKRRIKQVLYTGMPNDGKELADTAKRLPKNNLTPSQWKILFLVLSIILRTSLGGC